MQFSKILSDPAFPFFPAQASLPSPSPLPSPTEGTEESADVSMLPPDLAEFEMESPVPVSAKPAASSPMVPEKPVVPTDKDLNDRVADLLKALARDRYNLER